MRRRRFLQGLISGSTAPWMLGCTRRSRKPSASRRGRVVVLAFDGMDPSLLERLMQSRATPHFVDLANRGAFSPIVTSDPPQTPVAFSNIICGADAGAHQIFDFFHRDPRPEGKSAIRIYFSTSDMHSTGAARGLSLGKWRIPISGGEAPQLLRQGQAFWQPLVEQGAAAKVFFLPSNYPVQGATGPGELETISGMGTPDLRGGLGEFTFVTPQAPLRGRQVTGGKLVYANLWGASHRDELELEGVENYLLDPSAVDGPLPRLKVPFVVTRDPERDLVKIEIGGQLLLLKLGEWSDWIPIDLPTEIPGSAALEAVQAPVSLPGMVRFYVKQVHPECELYITPINIDPLRPATPISEPAPAAEQLASRHGRYYTLGIPEDFNALNEGALNEDEFLEQAYLAHDERAEQYRRVLSEFENGCLFYYFGTTDLVSHMFFRDRDPQHPGHDPAQGDRHANVIDDLYVHCDGLVGETLEQLRDEDTLLVLSDHGFTTFRRSVSINRLLWQQGYLVLEPGVKPETVDNFEGVDWSKTRAYAIGLNSVFVNLKGREKNGIVPAGDEQSRLLDELTRALLDLRDDEHPDAAPIQDVLRVSRRFPQANPGIAPDLIVGYGHGYRVDWKSPLGGLGEQTIADNLNRWSGDHCVASDLVPGVLLANRPLEVDSPALTDIGPSILALCGVGVPDDMAGRPLFRQ